VDFQKPQELVQRLKFSLPNQGQGKEGLLEIIQQVLQNSVNTWDQGFLDKLYASTNAVCHMLLKVLYQIIHILTITLGRCRVRLGPIRSKHQCKWHCPSSLYNK
jgi:glutamate decarboxylase